MERMSPSRVPGRLLEKYFKSGPRYTSYPTAPQFREDFDRDRIRRAWMETNTPKGKGLSLYVHIPFCKKRCLYCGCYTEAGHGQDRAAEYIRALLNETDRIAAIIDPGRAVEQFAMGGGTPTFLSPENMSGLVRGLRERFGFSMSGERSVEIDPRSVDADYLDLLIEEGFNRFSFGVQDLDPQVQENVGRVQSEDKIAGLLARLRERGRDSINLDLIYGLPGQTPETFGRTIGKVIKLRPSRIAMFGYAHVPWVSPHQKALENLHIPDPEERMALFGLAYDMLLDAGYEHVGMDHFALPGDELILALKSRTLTRNFMGYTTRRGLDLVGIGASSISSVDSTYTQNVKDVTEYIDKSDSYTWIKGFLLSEEDELRRELIIDLFCNFHLDTGRLEESYGIAFREHFAEELEALEGMQRDGLVEIHERGIKVTDLGRFFIRNICMTFDEYLKTEDSAGKYSRTI